MELRLYSFTNFYLSDMQKGIQTGHMAVDLVREYLPDDVKDIEPDQRMAANWADNWKTFIVLNGGNNAGLENAITIIDAASKKLHLPWTCFYEDEQSLNGLLTCVGVVVPEMYFNAQYQKDVYGMDVWIVVEKTEDRETIKPIYRANDPEIFDFINLIRTSRLA